MKEKENDSIFALLGMIFGTIIFTILNNLSGTMMGYVMPTYPSWLLYGTAILYTILFLLLAIFLGEKPFSRSHFSRQKFRHILYLGIITMINGITFQFSAPWIDGDLSQILVNIGIPIIAFLSVTWMKHRYSLFEWIGVFLVLIGIIVGLIPTIRNIKNNGLNTSNEEKKSNMPWWILCFAISALVQDIEQIFQERAFLDFCYPATTLFWYNLFTLPFYILVIPFESVKFLNGTTKNRHFSEAFENQWHAIRCQFGFPFPEDTVGKQSACEDLAWLWPLLFVIGYTGMFFFNAILIRKKDALYAVIISTIVPPIVGYLFSKKEIVSSENMSPFAVESGISFLLLSIGILFSGVSESLRKRRKKLDEEQPILQLND
jgi:drug/metabolite transporter (DMT)-like permease